MARLSFRGERRQKLQLLKSVLASIAGQDVKASNAADAAGVNAVLFNNSPDMSSALELLQANIQSCLGQRG